MSKSEILLTFWGGYLLGGAVFGIPRVIAEREANRNGDERVEEVQIHNQNLSRELGQNFETVNELSLDGYEDFTFTTKNGDVVEVCMGQYEVANKVAKVAGPISCTQEIEIAKG